MLYDRIITLGSHERHGDSNHRQFHRVVTILFWLTQNNISKRWLSPVQEASDMDTVSMPWRHDVRCLWLYVITWFQMLTLLQNISTARASIQKHGTANVWPWWLKWLEHSAWIRRLGFTSPSVETFSVSKTSTLSQEQPFVWCRK